MGPEDVLHLGRQALELTVMLAGPLLGASLAVGLMVAIFQAATQINEMTLTFIPKLIALVVVLLVAGPFFLRALTGFTIRLYSEIPSLIG